jgi:hypothetical protein
MPRSKVNRTKFAYSSRLRERTVFRVEADNGIYPCTKYVLTHEIINVVLVAYE